MAAPSPPPDFPPRSGGSQQKIARPKAEQSHAAGAEEPAVAVPRPSLRRRALSVVVVVLLVGVAIGAGFGVAIAITSWNAPPSEAPAAPPVEQPVDAGMAPLVPPPPSADAGVVVVPPPAPAPAPHAPAAAPRGPRHGMPRVVVQAGTDSATSAVKSVFERKLTRAQVVRDASAGFALGLLVSSGGSADAVHVSCKVTIAALPRNKLLGALSSSAEASGEGFSRAELMGDASRDCARALAEETDAWLRAYGDAR